LSWFDEPIGWLTELVASLAPHIDHLVAVDGAYGLLPGAEARSPTDQAHAITGACAGAGVGVTLHQPNAPWSGNETEKRSSLFALAHAVAAPGDDWLWVIDADEVVSRAVGLRRALMETDCDVAEVLLGGGEGYQSQRRLFRAHPQGITVTGTHYTYVDGDGLMLWGDGDVVPAEQLWGVRVEHRTAERPGRRHEKRRVYYRRRDDLGIERRNPMPMTPPPDFGISERSG
jgi:hypothetical protein